MPRRNAKQLDLLSYRPPRPPKNQRLPPVKVKFERTTEPLGHAEYGPGHVEFDILARRGSGDWMVVGTLMAHADDYSWGRGTRNRAKVGYYEVAIDSDDHDIEESAEFVRAHTKKPGDRPDYTETAVQARKRAKDWIVSVLTDQWAGLHYGS